MYNEYFGFRETPFNVTPNPRYFYSNPIFQEAYASLLYGVRERKGFIVLTGEVGTGKTTLLRRLMQSPEENVRTIFFYNTTLGFEELLSFACGELDLPVEGLGRLQKIQALNRFLIAQSQCGGTVVLLVDEAHNLTDDVLENLRLLSNLETASEKLLQIVLVGQTELEAKLVQPHLRQIKQRVALHCRLDSLKEREVGPFINYRLRMAGYEGEDLFSADAIRHIARCSKGIPRLINIICDNALLIGYATSAKIIYADIIREVAGDLQLDDTVRRVVDGESDTTPDADIPGENNANRKQFKIVKELRVHHRDTKSIVVGSLAAAMLLVFFIGGITFYGASFGAWLSHVFFSRFKQPIIQAPSQERFDNSKVDSEAGKYREAGEAALLSTRAAESAASLNNPTQGEKAQSLSTTSSAPSGEESTSMSGDLRN